MGKNNVKWPLIGAGAAIFFAVFFFYPLFLVMAKAFLLNQDSPQKAIVFLFEHKKLFWSTFFQALVSTIFSVLIGVPFGLITATRQFPGKKIISALSLVPFVFPSILVVVSFVIVFGNNGWMNNFLKNVFGFQEGVQFLYGFSGIILAHVFYNFSLIARFVSTALENTDASLKEAARTLGAGKRQVFFRITLPQIMPSIIASATIVFIYTFTSFAIVIGLGSLEYSTIEVEIYKQITQQLNFGLGALLALAQFAFLAALAFVFASFSKKFSSKEKFFSEKPAKLSLKTPQGLVETVFLSAAVLFAALPITALIVFAFFESGEFSPKAFEKIFFSTAKSLSGTTPLSAVFYSFAFALVSAATATLLGLASALKQSRFSAIEFFASASIAVSIITLGFGYVLGFGGGNFFIIAIGHAVLSFPFSFRLLKNALDKIESGTIDSARTLGAGNFAVLSLVQLPLIKNAIFASLAFGFAVSLGELGLTLVLYNGVYATMPVYIYRLLAAFDLHSAAAMGLILALASFLSFYAIEKFSDKAQVM